MYSQSEDTFSKNLFSSNDFTSYMNNQKSSFICGACNVGASLLSKVLSHSLWLITSVIKLTCG